MPNLRLQGRIYAVLWNKYPVMNRFIKPAKYNYDLLKPALALFLSRFTKRGFTLSVHSFLIGDY